MKRVVHFSGIFLCFLILDSMLFSMSAFAAERVIDTSTAADGYFTVDYTAGKTVKMKVGVTYGNSSVYYDYVPGSASVYTFTEGDGVYTITLFQNVSGTSYRKISSSRADVKMVDAFAPYLVSTTEITFSQEDAVGQKAAELCQGKTDDAAKVVAIHNYIAAYFTYDNEFAARVLSGEIKNYTPDTNQILAAQKGLCYDFSVLFAAMCRSQGIPCAVAKGCLSGVSHAWNMVYINGEWNAIDMTRAIAYKAFSASTLSDCVTALDAYSGMSY